eukprot:CAMPEP_0174889674 /NCGR_PEP_ID=MMETSP0167-20121228/4879_1 /TAXON_ID=38298 /ORGANISM="Rhodella maculata, Strain CCMP736" /LENGTH=144 /DNA_ID=CAMNT_0016127157 /DNA_START=286 /DNA_END=720 /DNA_ORIENTATION=-
MPADCDVAKLQNFKPDSIPGAIPPRALRQPLRQPRRPRQERKKPVRHPARHNIEYLRHPPPVPPRARKLGVPERPPQHLRHRRPPGFFPVGVPRRRRHEEVTAPFGGGADGPQERVRAGDDDVGEEVVLVALVAADDFVAYGVF